MSKLVSIIFTALLFSFSATADTSTESQSSFDLLGQISASTNGTSHFLNFGGPNIRAKWSNQSLGLSLFPSFRVNELPGGSVAQPQLGFGLFYEYEHLVVVIPFYALKEGEDTQQRLKMTLGLGYKF